MNGERVFNSNQNDSLGLTKVIKRRFEKVNEASSAFPVIEQTYLFFHAPGYERMESCCQFYER